MRLVLSDFNLGLRQKNRILLVLSLVYIICFTLSASLDPGDIPYGRETFKRGNPSDWLGTYAGFTYFLIPEWPLGWARNLVFIQLMIALIGLRLLVPTKKTSKRFSFEALLIVHYLVAVFSSQQSRDGALLSQLILGFGIINFSFRAIKFKLVHQATGILVLISGLAFRPIMSVPVVILLVCLNLISEEKSYRLRFSKLVGISLSILILPTSLELLMTSALAKQREYPLQTVLLQDLGFAACQSANPRTIDSSIDTLSQLATDADFHKRICQFYRIYTWQSLLGIIAPSATTKDLSPPIRTAQTSDEFNSLFHDWFLTMVSDPKTYAQAKFVSLTQVLFSSQTRIWIPIGVQESRSQIEELEYLIRYGTYLLHFPWVVLSGLYLLSPGIALFISVCVNMSLRSRARVRTKKLQLIPVMLGSVISFNAIFFVSDNARYSTAFVVCAFVFYVMALSGDEGIES